jgi:hypothetical protein
MHILVLLGKIVGAILVVWLVTAFGAVTYIDLAERGRSERLRAMVDGPPPRRITPPYTACLHRKDAEIPVNVSGEAADGSKMLFVTSAEGGEGIWVSRDDVTKCAGTLKP